MQPRRQAPRLRFLPAGGKQHPPPCGWPKPQPTREAPAQQPGALAGPALAEAAPEPCVFAPLIQVGPVPGV